MKCIHLIDVDVNLSGNTVQYLRLELQVDVDLVGVERHTHSAQDDVKCSLVQKRRGGNPISHIWNTVTMCEDKHGKLICTFESLLKGFPSSHSAWEPFRLAVQMIGFSSWETTCCTTKVKDHTTSQSACGGDGHFVISLANAFQLSVTTILAGFTSSYSSLKVGEMFESVSLPVFFYRSVMWAHSRIRQRVRERPQQLRLVSIIIIHVADRHSQSQVLPLVTQMENWHVVIPASRQTWAVASGGFL